MANFRKNRFNYLIFLLISLAVSSCKTNQKAFVIEGFTQGTYYRVTYFAQDSVVKKADVEQFLHDFLLTASLWEPNSIVSKINDNQPVELNADFIKIFNIAQNISQISDGAFDITVGDLVNLWGFGNKNNEQPSDAAIDSLKKFVGYQNIELKDNQIHKKYPETTLNLNAIAKGYSVDLLSELLKSKGLTSYLVDIGGEIRASGKKPDGKLWSIGIEEPSEDSNLGREVHSIITLTDKSVATSGTYRRYYLKDGIRYSHTIDPKTGYPINHTLLSVTVIAEECITADAMATVFMVIGKDKSMEFIETHPEYQAYFIYSGDDGSIKTDFSDGFGQYLVRGDE